VILFWTSSTLQKIYERERERIKKIEKEIRQITEEEE